MKLLAFVILLGICSMPVASDLAPFTTDGCSRFPDGTSSERTLWLDCCTAHDVAYWQGGTAAQRLQADQVLRQCVIDTGESMLASLMFIGVRVGGTPYLPTSFRWGYGWPYMRRYGALSDAEMAAVREALNIAEVEP